MPAASTRTATSTRVALRAWRRALVTASCASRNTAAATAGGTEPASPATRTTTVGASVRSRVARSARPGVGARSGESAARRTPTIARISRSVRDASPSIARRTFAVASGSVAATVAPAWAWIAIAETWWATVSWRSRASCSRSSRRTRSSSRAREAARHRSAIPSVAVMTATAMPPTRSPGVGVDDTKVRSVPIATRAPPPIIALPEPQRNTA